MNSVGMLLAKDRMIVSDERIKIISYLSPNRSQE